MSSRERRHWCEMLLMTMTLNNRVDSFVVESVGGSVESF